MKKFLFLLFIFSLSYVAEAQQPPTKDLPLPPSLQEAVEKEEQQYNGNGRFYQEFLRMMIWLTAIIIVLFGLMYYFKRFVKLRTDQLNEDSSIKVLEQRVLSAKATLYLVEFEGQTLLIAESHGGVQFLAKKVPFSLEK